MTGTTSRIIHSGRLFDSRKASTSFEPLDELFAPRLRTGFAHIDAKLFALLAEIDRRQHRAQRLGADRRGELVLAVIVLGLQIFFLIQ